MTPIRAATLLLILSSVSLVRAVEPIPIPWHSVPETATAVARGQQKMLLVYYRGACDRCNDAMDATFEKAAMDLVFRHLLDTYIPLRVTAGEKAAEHPIVEELAKLNEEPLLALYDAAGVQLTTLDRKEPWSTIVEELLRFRAERPRMVRAVEMRLAGHIPDADLMIGNALLNAQAAPAAIDRLNRAAKGFHAANDEQLAQMARVLLGSAWYLAGQKMKARTILGEVLRKPESDAVAAEAYLALGTQYESSAMQFVATINGLPETRMQPVQQKRDLEKAVGFYRKAYEIAPPESSAVARARIALTRLDDAALPKRKVEEKSLLRVVLPARSPVLGDTDFQVDADDTVVRVDYLLDGVKAASSAKRPFRVSIDVGRIPSAHTIEALAFDAEGNAKGEAVATINDRTDAFVVSIVAPAGDRIGGRTGVELDVRVPPGRTLSRVEVSWNGEEVAALKAPPFRTAIDVAAGEFGYLRSVAFLDDGTTAEATKLYNASGVSESVEVGSVTVLATVSDARGERIGGLASADFTIKDEGQAVAAALRSTDDDPVTIGIAIDSSSSMAGRQLYVIDAATQFLARALRPQDQAFVVAFDTGARLVHPRSGDANSLSESVYALTPQGGTSIFDGVTFALQQFQGISGKKALLVLTDGREGTSSASAHECERLAGTVGVPIYVIVPPGGNRYTNALSGMASLTGGTMFYTEPAATFPVLFDRLAAEMRGQYVLSFTRPAGIRTGTWRSLRVTVRRPDAKVRTIQGYRAN
jgi:VWFA-related protein